MMDESERLERGMKRRREVLGDEHVERAIAATTALDGEFQDLIARYAWGEIWTRPQLDDRTRRLLVVAMMVALGRDEELALHLRAGLERGLGLSDVVETLLQCAIYCGVPAANAAFRIAKPIAAGVAPPRSFAECGGVRIAYRIDGAAGAPVLMLIHSLGAALEMWDPQLASFGSNFRVLRYDLRGHGHSGLPATPWSIEALGRDAVALLDALEIRRAYVCGLSLGGMIGQWLGINAPDRLERLVLSSTAAAMGPASAWDERIEKVRAGGMASIASTIIARWFTPDFLAAAPAAAHTIERQLLATPPQGYVAACAAIRDMDQRAQLPRLAPATLVIAGKYDVSTPPERAREIVAAAPNARYVELDAAHLANVERPVSFSQAVSSFLESG